MATKLPVSSLQSYYNSIQIYPDPNQRIVIRERDRDRERKKERRETKETNNIIRIHI